MNVILRYGMFSLLSKLCIYRVAYLAVKCLTYTYDKHRLAKLSSKTYSTYKASYSFGTARSQSIETPSNVVPSLLTYAFINTSCQFSLVLSSGLSGFGFGLMIANKIWRFASWPILFARFLNSTRSYLRRIELHWHPFPEPNASRS